MGGIIWLIHKQTTSLQELSKFPLGLDIPINTSTDTILIDTCLKLSASFILATIGNKQPVVNGGYWLNAWDIGLLKIHQHNSLLAFPEFLFMEHYMSMQVCCSGFTPHRSDITKIA